MLDFWEEVLNHDTYSKGGQYSASNLINPPLITKLQEQHPDVDDVETKDKVSAWVGNAIHSRCEEAIVARYGEESVEVMAEVKMKFRSLSGTADIIRFEDDIHMIADIKTGKEANIIKKIKDSTDWIKQLSIYRYLATKIVDGEVSDKAEIYWLCTDTGKYGIHEIELLSTSDTVLLIKEFYAAMKTPIESEPMCDLCVAWRHRWCGVRSVCPFWGLREETDDIDEW